MADIYPQCLLPQCTVGDLHAEDLVEFHYILRRKPACPEEAASGLDARQHHHTHIPVDKETAADRLLPQGASQGMRIARKGNERQARKWEGTRGELAEGHKSEKM